MAAFAGIIGMPGVTIGPGIFSVEKSVSEPKNQIGRQKCR
jgi:hypothetical protein